MILLIEITCLIIASFFAGMETGLLSADKLKIYSQKEHGKLWAVSANYLLKKPERLLGTTLIGTNIAVVTSAVILNNYLRIRYSGAAAVAGSLLLTLTYLLFAEIIPKTFFRRYADSITVRLSLVMQVFFYLFLPFSFLLNLVVRVLMILLGQRHVGEKLPRSREDFRMLIHLSSRESGFGYDDYRTIDDILDFSMTLASEAMIPLHKYPVFHINTRPEEVVRIAGQMNQRFFPCYARRTDEVVGYIDIQDFCVTSNKSISQILQAPVFFPEVKPLPDLLDAMIEEKFEVVFLSDEYGGISGMVTHQQIASEIIGSIPGDIHTVKENVVTIGKNEFIAAGNTDLEYLSHVIDVRIKKGSNETLGGYLCEKLGIIPDIGTVYKDGHIRYTVLDGNTLQISRVRVEILENPDEGNQRQD
jgi:magnesium and cobalt exporter, CNNM family